MDSGACQCFVIASNLNSRLVRAESRRDDRRDPATQGSNGRAADRMHAIGEQYDVSLAEWIDPDGSPCETGVAVGADRKQLTAIGRKGRIDIPAQSTQDGLIRRRL